MNWAVKESTYKSCAIGIDLGWGCFNWLGYSACLLHRNRGSSEHWCDEVDDQSSNHEWFCYSKERFSPVWWRRTGSRVILGYSDIIISSRIRCDTHGTHKVWIILSFLGKKPYLWNGNVNTTALSAFAAAAICCSSILTNLFRQKGNPQQWRDDGSLRSSVAFSSRRLQTTEWRFFSRYSRSLARVKRVKQPSNLFPSI